MKTGIVTFFLGVLLLYQIPFLPDVKWAIFLVPSVLLFLFQHRFRWALAFICGFLWALFRADLILSQQLPLHLEGEDLFVTGTVVDLPKNFDKKQQLTFDVETIEFNGQLSRTASRMRLNWYENVQKNEISTGQKWRLKVRVKQPNGFSNPGGRDYEASLFMQGINAKGYIKEGERIESDSLTFIQSVHRLRSTIHEAINRIVPDQKGIISAMGVGIRDDLSQKTWAELSATGTIHLTAISGLHISLVAALGFFVGRWFWALPVISLRYLPAKKAGAVLAIMAAGGYAALAGFSVPTQRALIMVVVAMACVLSNRRVATLDVFLIALFFVVLLSPTSVISVGFWLSFAAVGIIFYVLSARTNESSLWHKSFKVHLILAIGLAPLLAYFFGQNPLLGPLANLIAVPFFALIITPLILLGILSLACSEQIADFILSVTEKLINLFWPILEKITEIPYSQLSGGIYSISALVICSIGIVIILMPKGLPGRWLAGIFFLPVFLYSTDRPEEGAYEFTLLDVGQGLAAVIRTKEHTLLYDTGPSFGANFDAGKAVIVPYLKANDINHLDMIIVSHGDNDHRGGYQSVLESMSVSHTLSSLPDLDSSEAISICKEGTTWSWNGVHFEILHPKNLNEITEDNENDHSCVLRVDNDYHSVLLSGDIEATAEAALVSEQSNKLDVDLLVAPHHGSRTSSTGEFIDATSPKYVLFPVGYRNRFHHPAEEIVRRYGRHTSEITRLDTASHGAINFKIGRELSKPKLHRLDEHHFWNRIVVE